MRPARNLCCAGAALVLVAARQGVAGCLKAGDGSRPTARRLDTPLLALRGSTGIFIPTGLPEGVNGNIHTNWLDFFGRGIALCFVVFSRSARAAFSKRGPADEGIYYFECYSDNGTRLAKGSEESVTFLSSTLVSVSFVVDCQSAGTAAV